MPPTFATYLVTNAGFTAAEAQELAGTLATNFFRKGPFLLRQGEVCHHAFFVESGLLRAFTPGSNGKEHIIQFAPENGFISDRSSVYFGEPSAFCIDAVEDSRVVLINPSFSRMASDLRSSFQLFNEKLLHNHIRQLQTRIQLLLGATAGERYVAFIRQYPGVLNWVPQWMIASYLGITPESLSRVRKALARRHSGG